MVDIQDKKIEENEAMVAPKGKGFTVYRGDAARKTDSKVTGTLYDLKNL